MSPLRSFSPWAAMVLGTLLCPSWVFAQETTAEQSGMPSAGDVVGEPAVADTPQKPISPTPAPAPDGEPGTPEAAPEPAAEQAGNEQADFADEELSASEEAALAQLEAEFEQQDSVAGLAASRLQLYGFADFTFAKIFAHSNSPFRAVLNDYSSFYIGNLNLYLRGELGNNWNSLAEVRFSYLPNGNRELGAEGVERTSLVVRDYTSFGRTRTTGGVILERAWLEYSAHGLLNVRAGQWLTPYGVWNVDHGSPSIVPVGRPYVFSLELLPERQVGVQLHGRTPLSDDWSGGYVLAVSNGRGPIEYADLDENKAVTTRLSAAYQGVGSLEMGASGYFGRYTDLEQLAIGRGASVRIVDQPVDQYDELGLALDVRWLYQGLHLQAELNSRQKRYTDAGRLARTARDFYPDHEDRGGYVLAGYRFDWGGLMPFMTYEYLQFHNVYEPGRPPDLDRVTSVRMGVNARPVANVTLKAELSGALFPGDHVEGSSLEYPLYAAQTQAAWAF